MILILSWTWNEVRMFRQAQIHPQAEKGNQHHQSNPRGVIKQPSMIQTHSSKNISGVSPAPSRDVTLFEAPQTSNIPTTICEETPGNENRIGKNSVYHTAILLQPKSLGFKPFRVLKACLSRRATNSHVRGLGNGVRGSLHIRQFVMMPHAGSVTQHIYYSLAVDAASAFVRFGLMQHWARKMYMQSNEDGSWLNLPALWLFHCGMISRIWWSRGVWGSLLGVWLDGTTMWCVFVIMITSRTLILI